MRKRIKKLKGKRHREIKYKKIFQMKKCWAPSAAYNDDGKQQLQSTNKLQNQPQQYSNYRQCIALEFQTEQALSTLQSRPIQVCFHQRTMKSIEM